MRIAITGASGSLGRALTSRLVQDGADRIVLFSRDEQKRLALEREFGWHPGVRAYAGDVRDERRLVDLFGGCEVVVHGAARKVVTAHPDEPEELLKTNILGTLNVIEACRAADVRKLIVVSSDKAVMPLNVYGVSKAMAEHIAINANARCVGSGMRIGVVRYGNVLGSTGSVVPLWRAALERGEPVTVTAPSMTRFWITLPQAVDLILSALANLRGGEIVVPHLPAASIDTLLRALIPPDRTETVLVRQTGVRQGGEKWHEQLLSDSEVERTVRRGNTYVVAPFQNDQMWDNRPWMGALVPGEMVYRSDVWPEQLDVDGMRALLARV